MSKVILTFGLLAGAIVALLGAIHIALWNAGILDFDSGQIAGYASMLIALSMVFFGIKSFRDRVQGGVLRFGRGLTVGLLISCVASAVYVVGWEVYYLADDEMRTTFMDKYAAHMEQKLIDSGASQEQLEKSRKEMEEFKQMYNVTALRLAFTLLEILPVAIVVSLISAAILRRKEVLPA